MLRVPKGWWEVSIIELSTKEIRDCEDDPVEIDSQPWRHGRKVRFAFPLRGSHYAAWIDVHTNEGWQLYGDTVTAVEVKQVERTVKVWEYVK